MSKLESSYEYQYCKIPGHGNAKEDETLETPRKYGYGTRHVQLVIFFFCMSVSFTARGHLGVTLVAMTSQQNIKGDNSSAYDSANSIIENGSSTNIYKLDEKFSIDDANLTNGFNVKILDGPNITFVSNKNEKSRTMFRSHNWPKPIQEMVLAAFFLGYCVMTFPMALICQRWGGKVPLQMSMFINGIVSILTPFLALWGGWKAVCVCRVLQGLSQAGTYPGIQTLLAQWVPSSERATLSGYVYTGSTLGNVIGFQLSGLIADAWGWPAVFWTIGLMCLLTCALLTFFGSSSPRVHKEMSAEEKHYIMGHSDSGVVQKRRAPWKAIITSKPVWANISTHVGSGVSFVFFFTQVPTYIHYILGVNVKNSGLLTSLPYLASFFTSLSFGVISDYFTNRNIVSVKNARRIFNTISQMGVATSLICASYASSTTVVLLCLVLSMSFHMGMHSGWMVNEIDLSPNYSGTLMALGNILMNLGILIMPVLVSNIVVDVTNLYQWRIMLFIVAAIAFIPNLIFVVFMSAEVQPWNEGDFIENKNDLELYEIKKKETET